MTDSTGGEAEAPEGPADVPQIQIRAQYVKDLSFENPNAPQSLGGEEAPRIEVAVDVGAQALGDDHYEVELRITANADRGGEKVFVVEVQYAGIFQLAAAPQEVLEPLCLIECPRFLFPFARQIVADATRDGGFPPLMLEPIDFVQLYQSSRAE